MRLLHTADWHIGELPGPVIDGQNARLMDTLKCIDFMVNKAEEEMPDAILISGDLFDKSRLWADTMLNLIDLAAVRLRRLAETAPTVLMFGTETHDNPKAFENIRNMHIHDLYVVTRPQLLHLNTKSGPLQVAAVPGFDKGYFRAQYPGMAPEEENAMCSKLLGDIILGLGAQVDPLAPSVLMSHYTVVGCDLDNGEHVFLQNDVVLPKESLAASPFNLVCMGHIHRAQEVLNCGRPVFYSGSPNGKTFNEEGQDKGFYIHEIGTIETDDYSEEPQYCESQFIRTPSREFSTVTLKEDWVQAVIENVEETIETWPWIIKDRIVRVNYACSEEQRKQLSHKVIEQALYKSGAFYVAEIKPVQVVTALQKQEMSENSDPLKNLGTWARREGFNDAETSALVQLAEPLVATVSAKMPTGKLSGVFIPKRLEVQNYRSYREESFEFNQITFATVNGPNGIGKSAFFMDAICDCLFEEPREGDLTGWITNTEDARSGSLTFVFGMGSSDWRVTRTRAKSGKTTLALAEYVDGEWIDRSGADKRETQQKIIALLGMDAMTFRCCALIMQDAYGLFMEADKEDRMQVLGNILGLNIYEQLTELAKNKVTDLNREINKKKDKLAELDEKLKAKPGLESELKEVEAELTVVAHEITEKGAALKDAQEIVRQLTVKKEKADELQKQIEAVNKEITNLQTDKDNEAAKLEKAQKMLESADKINEKAAEYEEVKNRITVLETKQHRLTELVADDERIQNEIGGYNESLKKLAGQINDIKVLLSNREKYQKAQEQYRETVTALDGMDALAEKYAAIEFKIREAEKETDRTGEMLWQKQEAQKDKEKTLASLKEKASMLADSNCIDPDNAQCAFLADAQKSKALIPEVDADIEKVKSEIEQIEKDREPLLKKVQVLEQEREALNYDPKEYYRLKQLAAELRPKAEKAAELSGKEELLRALVTQVQQIEKQRNDAIEHLNKVVKEHEAISNEVESLSELKIRLPKLEAWVTAKKELPVAEQIKTSAAERIAKLDKDIAGKENQVESLKEALVKSLVHPSEIETAQDNVDKFKKTIANLQDKTNHLHSRKGGLIAKLDALSDDEEERRQVFTEMQPVARQLTRYQTLSRAFGFDGIPFSIVRAVVPELSAMANEILGQMTGGKMSMEMRTERVQKSNKKEVNALEIWITDYQRGTLPYKSRSGGQKVKAALSVAFALADLKARRAGIQLGMLFIDEPPFLDGEGTEAYCDALELVSQRYPNMIVLAISHDPRMQARFPQVINVTDTEEGSKVRLVA